MTNLGQPTPTYRSRRQRANRDTTHDVPYLSLLERAQQRHTAAGRRGPLFLDPFDRGARRIYLDD